MKYMYLETTEAGARDAMGFPSDHLVLSEIIEVSDLIPKDVTTLNAAQAEYLAGRFLKGFEICGDLYAIAIGYESKTESAKKEAYNRALLTRAPQLGHKTAVDKSAYGFIDVDYLAADAKYNEAKMFRLFVAQKHQTFEKAHYHMRKLADREGNILIGRPSMDADTKLNDSTKIGWED